MKHKALAWALLVQLVLSTGYLLKTPAFEAPDEPGHFLYARQLLETGRLPVIQGTAVPAGLPDWQAESMGHHPPLYYLALAAIQRLAGMPDLSATLDRRPTPRAALGAGASHDEVRERIASAEGAEGDGSHVLLWIHGYDEVAPVSAEMRTFRLLRGFSVLCGLFAVALAYVLARQLAPGRPALAAGAALTLACWPQWSFVHGVLDNGNLATPLAYGVLVVLGRMLVKRHAGVPLGLLLGLVVGCALLTKLTALFSLVLVGGVYAFGFWKWREQRAALARSALACLALTLALAGWYYARNLSLYGEPLASAAHRAAYASSLIPEGRLQAYFFGRFPGEAWRSLVGSFGWGGVQAPTALVWGLAVLSVLGLSAWFGPARRVVESRAVAWLLWAAALLGLAGLVRYNLVFRQPQGRYLFASFGPWIVLVVTGWLGWASLLSKAARVWTFGLYLVALPLAAFCLLAFHVAPGLGFDPDEARPVQAALTAGLSTPPPSARATIELLAPASGASVRMAPGFRWKAPPGADPDSRYTVHFYAADGRVLAATFEMVRMELAEPRLDFPADFWPVLPAGEPVFWKVRRLPDRKKGEGIQDADESLPSSFVREP